MKDITHIRDNRMKIVRALAVLAVLLVLSMGKLLAAPADTFDQLLERISQRNEGGFTPAKLETDVAAHLTTYNAANGSFTDVVYTNRDKTDWKPIVHLDRLRNFIFAYTMPGNTHYQTDAMYDKIVLALEYWHAQHPTSQNWWHNQIATPKSMGVSLVQMRKGNKQLAPALEAKLIARLAADAGNPNTEEGANQIDVAMDFFYRACLTKDKPMLEDALGYAFSPLKFAGKELEVGIRHDYSFHQHGYQLYIGGYGDELIKGVVEFALNTLGTEYALQGQQLDIFSKFVRETYLTTVRGQFMHYNVMGRSVARSGSTLKSGFRRYIQDMVTVDPANAAEYNDAVKRMATTNQQALNIKNQNQLYPISDYVLHSRKQYSFGVRTVSERTSRVEHGNKENLKTYFLADGSTAMTMKGDEYRDIFPVWNWTRIPGTTSPQMTTVPKAPEWGVKGKATFVGGVSDSIYAVSTYVYDDKDYNVNTQAKKSWFFFDDEIVCLGAGITSTSGFSVNTTMEQSLLGGDITVLDDGAEAILGKGEHTYGKEASWVHHNRIGYFFPKGGNIVIGNQEQTGTWKDINTGQSDAVVKKDVFTLYFDHGNNPTNSTYAYVVVPNKLTTATMSTHKIDNINIVENNEKMQIVEHKGLGMWQMVFFEAGKFVSDKLTVEVDKPCTIMLKDVGRPEVTMHVADPAQTKSKIIVKTTMQGVSKDMVQTVCDFTAVEDQYAGYSKAYTLKGEDGEEGEEREVLYTREALLLGDTFVQDGAANENKNNGSAIDFLLKKSGVGYNREAYVKMSIADMSNLTNADTEEVGKVELSMQITYTNTSADGTYWILNPVADTSWDENTVTWVTRPEASSEVVSKLKGQLKDNTAGVPVAKNRVYFDITEYALAEYAKGKTEIAFRVYNDQEATDGKHDTKFGSKEHTNVNMLPKIIVSVYEKKAKQKYKVTVPQVVGATIDYDAGDYEVEEGKDFKFSVTVGSDYSNSKPIVSANGVELTPTGQDGFKYRYEIIKLMEDAVISVTGLVANDFSIQTLLIGGEVHPDPTKPYKVACGDTRKKISVEIQVQEGAVLNVKNKFDVDISGPVQEKIKITVGPTKDEVVNEYTLSIEKRFEFSDIVVQKFNSRLIANNNPNTNGGFTFNQYKWFKNGIQAGAGQIYVEGENNAQLDPSADYHLEVTSKGQKLSTCPSKLTLRGNTIKIYPVPANVDEPVLVETNDDYTGGLIETYTLTGNKTRSTKMTGKVTPIYFSTSGIHIIRVTTENGYKEQKIIIK